MWSYNARERRPRPAEPAGDGSTSYDGKDRTVTRSKKVKKSEASARQPSPNDE
jgi:hypothetical protein